MANPGQGLMLLVLASALALNAMAWGAEEAANDASGSQASLGLNAREPDLMVAATAALPAEFAIDRGPGEPVWYVQAEGLALKRDASGDRTFAAFVRRVWSQRGSQWVYSDETTPVLGTEDLHFSFEAGGRVLLGRTLGDCGALEVSYFDLAHWDQIAAVRDSTEFIAEVNGQGQPLTTYPASLFSPFSDFGKPPIVGLDYNELACLSYASSLNNLEWNLRRWIYVDPDRVQASVLVGGRYMNVGERFSYYTESAVPAPAGATNRVTTTTGNSLIGVQVGAMLEFEVDPGWSIDCEVKGGAFSNDAGQSTVYEHDGVAAYQGTHGGGRDDKVSAFALDVRLTATVLITPRLTVRGGYQALWLDGLALASENFNRDVNVLIAGPPSLVDRGKVVYHGPHLGVSWVW